MKNKKIKVLFDAGPLVNGSLSGVGKFTQGLIQELSNNYPNNLELVGHYFDFLNKKDLSSLPKAKNIRYRKTVLLPGKVFSLLQRHGAWIPFELLVKERGDFLLFPAFIGWPSLFRTPSTPAVHDLSYIKFPQYVNDRARHALKKLVGPSIDRAAFVITISESTKADINKFYGPLNKPVLVEHIPPVGLVTLSKPEASKILEKLGIDRPYILFLGNIEPRKNLVHLIDAYSQLPETARNKFALVLAGGSGWKDEEILQKINFLQSSGSKIYKTGYVSDEQRAALYMKASVFVLPSYYEGFGMPLLEAMTYQTPMLISDITALREVAEDTALYCDPNSAKDISKKLLLLLEDDILQKQLVNKGNLRLKDFSWQKVTKELYEQIAKSVE
ncbi:MAG: glycosyltransferase family 4 protein [Candidatus Saccharimonadales bacterium]